MARRVLSVSGRTKREVQLRHGLNVYHETVGIRKYGPVRTMRTAKSLDFVGEQGLEP